MQLELSTSKYLDVENVDKGLIKSKRKWATPLSWICVLFMLISLTGALSAAYGFYKLSTEVPLLEAQAGMKASQVRAINETRQAARDKYMPLLVYQELLKLALAGAFFFGVSMLVSRSPKARAFVIGLCGMALFYHLCAAGISILMIKESGGMMNSFFDEVIADARYQHGLTQEQADRARNAMQNSAATTMVIALSIALLIKVGFYGAIMGYFWSDDIKEIFGEDSLEYLKSGEPEPEPESALASLGASPPMPAGSGGS